MVFPSVAPSAPSNASAAPADRYPGGIPKTIGGERVYLGFGAFIHGEQMTDPTPFLAGGWFGDGSTDLCTGGGIVVGSPEPDVFKAGCGSVIGADAPWATYSWPGPLGWIAWNGHSLPNGRGPAVIRVHTHDPRSRECSSASRLDCEERFIIDAVVWIGDTASDASPIAVTEAVARLDGLLVLERLPIAGGTLAVERHVFPTFRQRTCRFPPSVAMFDLQGDPRFGLLAVFPTVAARVAAQPSLTSNGSCAVDSRIVRPGIARWVAVQNVLVLTFGDDAAAAVEKALAAQGTGLAADIPQIGFPPSPLDESYAFLSYYLAARAAGNVDTAERYEESGSSQDEIERRYQANALSYVIGQATIPGESQLPPAMRPSLASQAASGTVRMFQVTHPDSTDPTLRAETFICYELVDPQIDSWSVQRLEP
jgi:hypothetical protein